MTIPIYRPYVFLRCKKCGRKTEHVLIRITISSPNRGLEENYECQECGDIKKIHELVSEFGSALKMREGEVAVVTYTSAMDKMKVFSDFISEGLENGDLVDYTYPDEERTIVGAKLKEYGIDVKTHEKNGNLLMRSLTQEYLPDGYFDKDRAIEKLLDRRAEAKKNGYKHFRELEDVGDFSFLNGQWQTFIDLWDDPKWEVLSGPNTEISSHAPFVIEMIAFDVEARSEAQIAEMLRAFWERKPSSTLFIDTRSYTVATTHLQEYINQFANAQILKQMNGNRKILLWKDVHR